MNAKQKVVVAAAKANGVPRVKLFSADEMSRTVQSVADALKRLAAKGEGKEIPILSGQVWTTSDFKSLHTKLNRVEKSMDQPNMRGQFPKSTPLLYRLQHRVAQWHNSVENGAYAVHWVRSLKEWAPVAEQLAQQIKADYYR